jgi:hypothetical protein
MNGHLLYVHHECVARMVFESVMTMSDTTEHLVIPSEKYPTIFDYELYSTDYSMNEINV